MNDATRMTSSKWEPWDIWNFFMDNYFVPLKEGRRAKGAGQAPQNYVRASRIPKKKSVAKHLGRNLSLSNFLIGHIAKQFS
jgi:hypothetical protein